MSEYRVLIQVKNNNILSAIERCGYKNVNAFCVATGNQPSTIGEFINFKRSPLLKDGDWSVMALRLADTLLTTPDSLFSEAMKTMRLKTNKAEREYGEEQMLQMVNDTPEMLMIKHDAKEAVHELLDCLTPRELAVVELRFGIHNSKGIDHTLDYVADFFDVSKERIRQIEIKALRKLKNRSLLGDFGQKKPEPEPEEIEEPEVVVDNREFQYIPRPTPEEITEFKRQEHDPEYDPYAAYLEHMDEML